MKQVSTQDIDLNIEDAETISPSDHSIIEVLDVRRWPIDIVIKNSKRRFVIQEDGIFTLWSSTEGIVLAGVIE